MVKSIVINRKDPSWVLLVGLTDGFQLDIKIEFTDEIFQIPKYSYNTRQVPVYFGEKGYKLSGYIPIVYYLISMHDTKSPLLGLELCSRTKVLEYVTWCNTELMTAMDGVAAALLGKVPFKKKSFDDSKAKIDKCVDILQQRLVDHEYLAGDCLTAADLFVASSFHQCFTMVLGEEWRRKHDIFMRWFNRIIKTEYLSHAFNDVEFIEVPYAVPIVTTRKNKKSVKPLKLLGPSKRSLKKWRQYYSREYRNIGPGMPAFWNDLYDDKEWTLWLVSYRNRQDMDIHSVADCVIGDFMQNIRGKSKKYVYGKLGLYASCMQKGCPMFVMGVFVIRGEDEKLVFPDVPDFLYKRLDGTDQKTRELVTQIWTSRTSGMVPIMVDSN